MKIKKTILLIAALMATTVALDAQNKKVAVMETKVNEGVSSFQSSMVRGGMEAAVANAPGFEGYDRAAFDVIMKEQNFQRSGAVNDAQIRELGIMAGVQYVLVSEASTDGQGFFILAKLLDVETGQLGKVVNTFCNASGQDIFNASNQLGAQLFDTYVTTPIANGGRTTTPGTGTTTTPAPGTTTPEMQYNVNKKYGDFTVFGWQLTDYEDNAKALKSLKDAITDWGGVRTGDIAEDGAGVVIYKNNGYSYTGFGDTYATMKDKIKQYNNDKERMSDVTFNTKGHYAIIRGKNGYGTHGLPSAFLDKLKELSDNGEEIVSVTLDESDNWAYVSDKHFGASNTGDHKIMEAASEKFGYIYSVCITTKGIVVCCENGVYFKNVPSKVVERIEALLDKGYHPKVVKFTDSGTCLVTDGDNQYTYFM